MIVQFDMLYNKQVNLWHLVKQIWRLGADWHLQSSSSWSAGFIMP